jgi:hypothetical protein
MLNIADLEKKWSELISEGEFAIRDPKVRKFTAIMLENQERYLVEAGMSQTSAWKQSGYSTNGEFHQIAIPMVRRTFPELIAHEVVGVQPLTGPVGIAFALRFKSGQSYADKGVGAELGHNTVDKDYSGSYPTSAGERLGSRSVDDVDGFPGVSAGIGKGTGKGIKEVNMTIEKKQVEAETRKLRSRWSLEVAQDLKAMHGLDLEEEMLDILAYEITAEIDREVIDAIRAAANLNIASNIAGKLGKLNWANTAHFDGRWEHEKYRNLFNLLIRKANRIAIDTRRGAGNFVVANPTICAAFEGTSSFTLAPVNTDVDTSSFGVSFIGNLDGRMKLYRDTFCDVDEFVVGYKGPSPYDSGIIYLPYIQLMVSKATFEDSFHPTVGLMSRYAIMDHLFGAQDYYIRCVIDNMP